MLDRIREAKIRNQEDQICDPSLEMLSPGRNIVEHDFSSPIKIQE
jgi:hypothetical protein